MKYILFYNTIKYLKWSQIYFRVLRKLVKPKVTDRFDRVLPERNSRFVNFRLYDEKINQNMQATFLNHTKRLELPQDWNDDSHNKLWLYNLHYFDDLVAKNATTKHSLHLNLLDSWQTQNPEGIGNGWEAYPISLRISNIIKAWQAGLQLERRHFESLYAQASFLENGLEKHLLGNHYLANLKALLFAGIVFDNEIWLHLAVKGLTLEIPEQILEDGAHFELSPMYHCLILVDILDMYNLCQAYPDNTQTSLFPLLKNCIPKMLRFMNLMTHNDQGLSFFNDSVDGIAPKKQQIEMYAAKLGFEVSYFDTTKLQVIDSKASGYMVASNAGSKLIFDAANIGPDYIPGHAHADTLSFELSIGNERVFVNTGTSEYGNTEKRLQERQTAAHNTVEVNSCCSSQVWSSFRVGKRACVIERSASCEPTVAILNASHDGYKNIFGGPIHKRRLILLGNKLYVSDELTKAFQSATARFYLHPNLKARLKNNSLEIIGKRFKMTSEFKDLSPRLVKSTWHPSFGLSKQNICIEYKFKRNIHVIEFLWSRA